MTILRKWSLLQAMIIVGCFAGPISITLGQEASPDDLVADPAESEETPPPTSTTNRLAVDIIRQSDPQSASEILNAVRNLLDLKETDLAKEFLGRWAGLQLNDKQRKELVDEFGAAFLVRIASDSRMSPLGRQVANELIGANRRLLQDPAEVARHISALSSDDDAIRMASRRSLREAAGAAAIPLLRAIVASDAAHRTEYLRALVSLGSDAEGPLVAALESSDASLRRAAMDGLTYTGGNAVLPIAASLLHVDPSADVRAAADRFLRRRVGTLPQRAEVILQVRQELSSLLVDNHRPTSEVDDEPVLSWRWDPATDDVVTEAAAPRTAAARRASQLGHWLRELSPSGTIDQFWYVVSQITYATERHGAALSLEESSAELFGQLARYPSTEQEQMLAKMLDEHQFAAATGLVEVLGKQGSIDLLSSVGGLPSPLARALSSSDRRLTLAAGRSIMQLDPSGPFPGAADVVELAGYLARSEGTRRALIIHGRSDHAGDIAGWLQNIGFAVDQVTTARRAELVAGAHPDYELILMSDQVGGTSWYELYQRLRRQPRVASIPLALIVRSENSDAAAAVAVADPFAITYPFPYDEETLQSIVRRTTALHGSRYVPPAERLRNADEAIQWLERMSGDRQRYRFYEVLPWQETLLNALQVPPLARNAMRALARLGTPDAQWGLVEFASRSSVPLADRQAAANAFHYAAVRSGLQLSPVQIRCQYDRHRDQIGLDVEAEGVLRQIVDAIERH